MFVLEFLRKQLNYRQILAKHFSIIYLADKFTFKIYYEKLPLLMEYQLLC